MIRLRIVLPPPDLKRLHAHAKGHWRSKSGPTKALRAEAKLRTTSAMNASRGISFPWEAAEVEYLFRVPDRIRRDLANMVQANKAAIDGVVDAGLVTGDHWEVLSIGRIRAEVSSRPATVLIFTRKETT